LTMKRSRFCSIAWILTMVLSTALGLAQTGLPQGTYITKAAVNVRKGPGTNYEIVAKIPKGAKVQVVGKEGNWLKVQSKHGNPPGYVDERFVLLREAATSPTASVPGTYVTTATVNVRSGPGTSHAIVTKIPKATKVQVVGAEGDWLKVQSKHGNPPGYIQKKYARLLSAG
jgi:uncharacterized protein YgiM (DUF1202 family)